MAQELFYSDLDDMMSINEVTKDFVIKKNNFSIKQSVRSLLKFHFYDKEWIPECGSYFSSLLFSQNDSAYLSVAREAVLKILAKYEPRIRVHNVDLVSTEWGEVNVTIEYEIIVSGARDTFKYTVTRTR